MSPKKQIKPSSIAINPIVIDDPKETPMQEETVVLEEDKETKQTPKRTSLGTAFPQSPY